MIMTGIEATSQTPFNRSTKWSELKLSANCLH